MNFDQDGEKSAIAHYGANEAAIRGRLTLKTMSDAFFRAMKIDWKLPSLQQISLLNAIESVDDVDDEQCAEDLQGIEHMIEDLVVKSGAAREEDVFVREGARPKGREKEPTLPTVVIPLEDVAIDDWHRHLEKVLMNYDDPDARKTFIERSFFAGSRSRQELEKFGLLDEDNRLTESAKLIMTR